MQTSQITDFCFQFSVPQKIIPRKIKVNVSRTVSSFKFNNLLAFTPTELGWPWTPKTPPLSRFFFFLFFNAMALPRKVQHCKFIQTQKGATPFYFILPLERYHFNLKLTDFYSTFTTARKQERIHILVWNEPDKCRRVSLSFYFKKGVDGVGDGMKLA